MDATLLFHYLDVWKLHRTRYLNFKLIRVHQRFPYRSFPNLYNHPHFISGHKCMKKFRLRPARYWSFICRIANRIHGEELLMSSLSHTVLSLYNSSVWHDPHCWEFSGRFGYRVVTCCHHAYSWRNGSKIKLKQFLTSVSSRTHFPQI